MGKGTCHGSKCRSIYPEIAFSCKAAASPLAFPGSAWFPRKTHRTVGRTCMRTTSESFRIPTHAFLFGPSGSRRGCRSHLLFTNAFRTEDLASSTLFERRLPLSYPFSFTLKKRKVPVLPTPRPRRNNIPVPYFTMHSLHVAHGQMARSCKVPAHHSLAFSLSSSAFPSAGFSAILSGMPSFCASPDYADTHS